jgi:excisionase family DNA binding protein
MPFFLKTYDIAVLLDVSPDDVNAMARKGLIKGQKIGKQWRFRNRDVKKILDQKRTQMLSQGGFEPFGYGR